MSSSDLDISTPKSAEALDIPLSVVTELFLRRTFVEDTVTISSLAEAIGISGSIMYQVFEQLRPGNPLVLCPLRQKHNKLLDFPDCGLPLERPLEASHDCPSG